MPRLSRHSVQVLRRTARFVGTLLLVTYFLFCALFLGLRYIVLPGIDGYKGHIERLASDALGKRVSIGTIRASWHGLQPHLRLTDVALYDAGNVPALTLPEVAATLSWWSIPAAQPRLDRLEILRPDMQIRRDVDGKVYVAGIYIDPNQQGSGGGANWVLTQHEIVIRNGRLRWTDAQRHAPELLLNDVQLLLRNQWRRHRLAVKAMPVVAATSLGSPVASAAPAGGDTPEAGAPLDLRADFSHPPFSRKPSDASRWTGQLYADLREVDLAAWTPYVDYPFAVRQGRGSVRAWLDFDHAKVADLTADLALAGVSARLAPDLPPLELARVEGRLSASEQLDSRRRTLSLAGLTGSNGVGARGHRIALTDFSLQTADGLTLPPTTLTERYTAATAGAPAQTEVSTRLLDLQVLTGLAAHLPLPPEVKKALDEAAPKGTVRNVYAQWANATPAASYRVKGEFAGLSMRPIAKPAAGSEAKTAPPSTAPAAGDGPAKKDTPATAQLPGFANLTGSIDASDRGGALTLASADATLQLPGILQQPEMAFQRLDLRSRWSFPVRDELLVEVEQLRFAQQGVAGSLSGSHRMALNGKSKSPGVIQLKGELSQFDLTKIGDYLPQRTPERLQQWLTGALQGGNARNVGLILKGDLADFPFRKLKEKDLPKGIFSVIGRIENGKLDYAPGQTEPAKTKEGNTERDAARPLWPVIDGINGIFTFDRTHMEVRADNARTHGVGLSEVKVSIPDLLSDDRQVDISGNAAGPLQEAVGFINDSPVTNWIGRFVEDTKASGQAKLALTMKVFLARLPESKVNGVLQLMNNDVVLQPIIPPLSRTTGKLEFYERGFTLNGLRAGFLGGQAQVTGGSQRDGSILVKGEGNMTGEGLRANYPLPAMQRLLARVNGATHFSTTIEVKNKHPEITIESGLQGIALDFPSPLKKAAGDPMPLKFVLAGVESDDVLIARDEIRIALGSSIEARYRRQKPVDRKVDWRVTSGGIGVNVPAPQPDSGLIANVSLRSLSIDDWRNTVNAIAGSASSAAAAAPTTTPAGDNGTTSDQVSLTQYVEPNVLAARATELFVMGKKLDNVVVGASHDKKVWQVNIDSEQASGYLTWNESASGRGLGKVSARLASLTIPQATASDVNELVDGKSEASRIPALDVVADNFQLFGKQFGRLEISANNVRGTRGREWRINQLSIANPDVTLKASGVWTAGGAAPAPAPAPAASSSGDGGGTTAAASAASNDARSADEVDDVNEKALPPSRNAAGTRRADAPQPDPSGQTSQTSLTYALDIADAGRALERFGFANVLKGGKGRMDGDINWNGMPFSLDIPSLSGQIHLDLQAGQFLKVDPKAAKLLGVLSLQSLPRRLTLDFRDVFSEGFAFDGIVGTATISQGRIASDNFKMRSVAATVLMSGSADIARETQNLHVVVIPEINVGAASVVYGLAVNPVIGLGTFLAQLFLRDPLSRAFTFEYSVTGPWKDPTVTKINRKTGQPVIDAEPGDLSKKAG